MTNVTAALSPLLSPYSLNMLHNMLERVTLHLAQVEATWIQDVQSQSREKRGRSTRPACHMAQAGAQIRSPKLDAAASEMH